jgi:hypothetical protein
VVEEKLKKISSEHPFPLVFATVCLIDFMKICFVVFLIIFSFSCQSQTVSRDIVYNGEQININNNIIKAQEKTKDYKEVISTTTLKCGDKDFNLLVVNKNDSKSVIIAERNMTRKTLNTGQKRIDI